ncbi:MAG: response regulator transcription factor [Chloroflexi bacterium]|nr:response regulator transcription factor [Chloroflexota bacterium]
MNPSTPTGKILVVDDEKNIRRGLRTVLSKQGHEIREAASAEEALQTFTVFKCEVAILDIRMPGMSGVELLTAVREHWPHIAIIILTGHGTLDSAMTAVKAGAHDYLLKPAQPDTILKTVTEALTATRRRREQDQLLTTLRTGLQRLGELPQPENTPFAIKEENIHIADLFIDCKAHQAYKNSSPLPLTPSEFNLLVALTSHAGEALDYVTLVKMTLDYEADPWEAKELIKRHIFALRKKIELDSSSPQYILNVRGVGYRLAAPQTSDTT